ncbi:MAG: hypothetical protein JSV13_01435 [Nitrospiraceae bacterium]|nr:MAG: hypothetical protein JSV13_01435 [Nitrospiraceae bacterium]
MKNKTRSTKPGSKREYSEAGIQKIKTGVGCWVSGVRSQLSEYFFIFFDSEY